MTSACIRTMVTCERYGHLSAHPNQWHGCHTNGGDPVFPWSLQFWQECHSRMPCLIVEPEAVKIPEPKAADIGPRIIQALSDVSNHWITTSTSTAVDPVHEGTFTFVLYALTCLLEMVEANRLGIAGRLLLRTIADCRITLAYLMYKNDPELWAKFHRYGIGQAKLALLKINEAANPPHGISKEKLERLANEDVWQEFVDIDLGNWAQIDLRKMAEESGTKDVYDSHYGWTQDSLTATGLPCATNSLKRSLRVPMTSAASVSRRSRSCGVT